MSNGEDEDYGVKGLENIIQSVENGKHCVRGGVGIVECKLNIAQCGNVKCKVESAVWRGKCRV